MKIRKTVFGNVGYFFFSTYPSNSGTRKLIKLFTFNDI